MQKLSFWAVFFFCALVFMVISVGNNESTGVLPAPRDYCELIVENNADIHGKLESLASESLGLESQITNTICGTVQSGQSFYSIMCNQGFPPLSVSQYIDAFKPLFNCSKISVGDEYKIITDKENDLVSFTIITSPIDIFTLRREGEGLVASKEHVVLQKKVVKVGGAIEGSIFGTIAAVGENDQLAIQFADIFAWDIDFIHDLHEEDQITIVFEKFYKEGAFVWYGKILAAEYKSQQKTLRAIYFEDAKGRGDYYSPEGISVRRCFLRSPLRFTRISSGYNQRRFHPILKTYRPHLGIDFAAPTGTPVWAVADGVVSWRGWKNGNGNAVVIRHPNGYETMYNHLSRYGQGVKRGASLHQKDIIGYVGSTGLSTGPHLDYRLKKNGVFINPLKEKFPTGIPIPDDCRQAFLKLSRKMIATLQEETLPPAAMVAEVNGAASQ